MTSLKQVDLSSFKEEVLEQFDGYDYEDIEDIIGFESWEDISKDRKYELNLKIDH